MPFFSRIFPRLGRGWYHPHIQLPVNEKICDIFLYSSFSHWLSSYLSQPHWENLKISLIKKQLCKTFIENSFPHFVIDQYVRFLSDKQVNCRKFSTSDFAQRVAKAPMCPPPNDTLNVTYSKLSYRAKVSEILLG